MPAVLAISHRLTLALAVLSLCVLPTRAWDASLMQAAAQKLGPAAVSALPALHSMLASLQGMPDAERLSVVNQYFNQRIAYGEDIDVWGEEDRWASPLETLAKGRGDCEDYAIAKYASLLAAGVAPSRLRLVYVRARQATPRKPSLAEAAAAGPGRAHIVLAYQAGPADEPLILDNLKPEVLPSSARPDLTPVFSFGTEGLWHGIGSASAGDPLARLSRWREVWNKVRVEGFL
jgi:predicted transglutaminase-like cysteine proteinase